MTVHDMQNLREYALDLYLWRSSKDGNIAKEYFEAISGGDAALRLFCERYSDPAPDAVREFESQNARELLEKLERGEGHDFNKKGRDVVE
jgi:hypothetical protein